MYVLTKKKKKKKKKNEYYLKIYKCYFLAKL